MNREVRMDRMTWQDFKQIKRDSVVILPLGSCEQHGPHLPLGVDVIISSGIAVDLAKKIGGAVAPATTYGMKSLPSIGRGENYSGNIFLNGETVIHLYYDVLEALVRDGVTKIFVSNGHWENDSYMLEAIDLVSKKYSGVKIVMASWWDHISEEVLEKVYADTPYPFPGMFLSHAEVLETSLVMNYEPETVKMDRLVDEGHDEVPSYYVYPIPEGYTPPSGLNARAFGSTAEKGALLAEDIVGSYERVLRKEFQIT